MNFSIDIYHHLCYNRGIRNNLTYNPTEQIMAIPKPAISTTTPSLDKEKQRELEARMKHDPEFMTSIVFNKNGRTIQALACCCYSCGEIVIADMTKIDECPSLRNSNGRRRMICRSCYDVWISHHKPVQAPRWPSEAYFTINDIGE